MAGLYGVLDKPANIAGFVVIYGYVPFLDFTFRSCGPISISI